MSFIISFIEHVILPWLNGLMYRIDVWVMQGIGTIDLLPLQKLVLVYEAMCSLLHIYLGFSEHI